jgi:transposase
VRWATTSGRATAELVATIMASRAHPQQGFRSCLGLMRLGKSFGAERLEAACRRALNIRAHSYKSVHSILKNRLDEKPLPPPQEPTRKPIVHDNIRGATYYHAEEEEEEEEVPGASAHEKSTSEPCTEHTPPEPAYR